MGYESKIEWTHHTFNIVWGCTNVSEGCRNCYAHMLANRYGYDVWGRSKERRKLSDNYWKQPISWNSHALSDRERKRVFCSSMADVFEDHITNNEERPRLWNLIRQTPWLDWLLLTKRPQNIVDMLPQDWGDGYSNVWLGASVEDERVLHRIGELVSVPAVVHFLSIEPLIGPLPNIPLDSIEWVIVGGESGNGCRPMEESWVLDIRRQCAEAAIPFFFKQWGGARKNLNGRTLLGRTFDEVPKLVVEYSDMCAIK